MELARNDVIAGNPNELAELLDQCRRGNEEAWQSLFEAHFGFVHRVARRLGTPDYELDDICQDVFLVVFRKLADFGEGRFTTWLYRIVANVVSQRHRWRRLRRFRERLLGPATPDRTDEAPTPDRQIQTQQTGEIIRRGLEKMAPKKREVFVLFELEGLSGEAIAELVGCRVETVWTRLHYARRELARRIERAEQGYRERRRELR